MLDAATERWRTERDAIADDVRTRGFNPDKRCYTRSYGSDDLDSAVLVLPFVGIEPRLATAPEHD